MPIVRPESEAFAAEYTDALDRYDYNVACDYVWSLIGQLDKELTDTKPFTVVKTDPEAGKAMIAGMTKRLYTIARLLQPIIPATSDALKAAILANKKPTNLFPRKE